MYIFISFKAWGPRQLLGLLALLRRVCFYLDCRGCSTAALYTARGPRKVGWLSVSPSSQVSFPACSTCLGLMQAVEKWPYSPQLRQQDFLKGVSSWPLKGTRPPTSHTSTVSVSPPLTSPSPVSPPLTSNSADAAEPIGTRPPSSLPPAGSIVSKAIEDIENIIAL